VPESDAAPVRCMFLPFVDKGLLVPSTGVAEIVGLSPPKEIEGGPHWLAGLMNWRGLNLPLISVERVLGEDAPPPGVRNRVAVMHTLSDQLKPAFYGIVIQRLPTVVLASERNVDGGSGDLGAWMRGALDLEVGRALIANFEHLETELGRLAH
jgi:chemosensory pili system protein ChpC